MPTIAGKPVNFSDFQTQQRCRDDRGGVQQRPPAPRTLEFEDQINIQAVQRLVLMRKAREFGITVPDSELVQEIRSQAIFYNEAKQFDQERYQRFIIFLNNFGISESRFEQIMREELTISHLQGLVASAVKVTPQEVDLAYGPLPRKSGLISSCLTPPATTRPSR